MKSIKSTPYLYRRNGIFYFRRVVPLEPTTRHMVQEVKLSLRTSSIEFAKCITREIANCIDGALRIADMSKILERPQILEIVRKHFLQILADEGELITTTQDPKELIKTADFHAERYTDLKEAFKKRDYSPILETSKMLLKDHSQGYYDTKERGYKAFLEAIFRAEMESSRILMNRAQGEWHLAGPQDPMFTPILEKISEKETKQKFHVPTAHRAYSDAPIINSTFIEKYIKSCHVQKDAADDKRRAVSLFLDRMHKGMRIDAVTTDQVRDFRDDIQKLPKRYTQKSGITAEKFQDLIALPADVERVKSSTAAKYFNSFKNFLKWCYSENYVSFIPGEGITLKENPGEIEDGSPFTPEELQLFFNAPIYRGYKSNSRRHNEGDLVTKDCYYWMPLIALYSGARAGEIAQLVCKDIEQNKNGIYYFNHSFENPHPLRAKSFKSKKARQADIPVHPALKKLGLIEYAEDMSQKNGALSPLFPSFSPGSKGFSDKPSKFYSELLKRTGIKRKGIKFHSFRHTFIESLTATDIEDSRLNSITGHAQTGVAHQIYKKTFTADELKPYMDKLIFDIDLSHLYVCK